MENKTVNEKFSEFEKKILNNFFNMLEEKFSSAGCNDFYLPNNSDGKKLQEESVRYNYNEKDANQLLSIEQTGKEIHIIDADVFSYLRAKIERALN